MNEFFNTFSSNWKFETPTKKKQETILNKLLLILNSIKELLKCEICKNYYDLNVYSPFITKCGHTFCKKCLITKSNSQKRKVDKKNTKNSKDVSSNNTLGNENNTPNLLINLIIKEINNIYLIDKNLFNPQHQTSLNDNFFNLSKNGNATSHKKIEDKRPIFDFDDSTGYINSESKKKNLTLFNLIKNNDIKKNNTFKENNNINFNSNNHIINLNSINVNIETTNLNKKEKLEKGKTTTNEHNDIKKNISLNSGDVEGDDDSRNENEEIQLLDEKCDFCFRNGSIDSIPLNEEKSIVNMSFKNEYDDILNNDYIKSNIGQNYYKSENIIGNDLLCNQTKDNNNNQYPNKQEQKQIINDNNNNSNIISKNDDISFGPKSKNFVLSNDNNNTSNVDDKNKKNINQINNDIIDNNKVNNNIQKENNLNINNNLNKKKIKSRQKFLFIDSEKDNDINNEVYLTQKNDNININLNNINNINEITKGKLLGNNNKRTFFYINNEGNEIFKERNNSNEYNKRKIRIIKKSLDISNKKIIKSKLSILKDNIIGGNDNNKGWETSRIPPSKSMNLNYFNDNNSSSDKNINNSNKEKMENDLNNNNEKTSNLDKNIISLKIKKKIVNSRNKSRTTLIEPCKAQTYRTIQNIKKSSVTYNKKLILSKKSFKNEEISNNKDEKETFNENFKTIDSVHRIRNNKLNSFTNTSIMLYKNKKITSYKNKDSSKTNSISVAEKTFSKNEPISEKVPKLSLNSLKDNKEIASFNVSPINSSRYDSKIPFKKNKNFNTPINSGINMSLENNSKKNSNNKDLHKSSLNEDNDININIDLINLEENILKQKNIIDKTIEKLKNDFDFIFSNNNNLQNEIKNNKNKYYEIFNKTINRLKNEKEFPNMILKFISNDFFIGILEEKSGLPKKGGIYTFAGDHYIGEFVNGKKEGNGIILYNNGTKYEGTFKNDKHDGFGKLFQLDGENYVGEWKEGKINGNGIRHHSNGDKYIGNYINNIRNGEGNYIFANGDSYNGNWTNGCANGFGKFNFKNGNSYEGNFKKNVIYGEGVYKMKNGDIYIGFFKYGLINGKGTCYNIKGEKYVGNFVDGKKNGFGQLYDKNGKIIHMGIWKDNKFTF